MGGHLQPATTLTYIVRSSQPQQALNCSVCLKKWRHICSYLFTWKKNNAWLTSFSSSAFRCATTNFNEPALISSFLDFFPARKRFRLACHSVSHVPSCSRLFEVKSTYCLFFYSYSHFIFITSIIFIYYVYFWTEFLLFVNLNQNWTNRVMRINWGLTDLFLLFQLQRI